MRALSMATALLLLLRLSSSPAFAAQGAAPVPPPGSDRTTSPGAAGEDRSIPRATADENAKVEPGKATPKASVGLSPAVKARRQAKKKAMAAGAARGRAEFQSALQRQEALAQQERAFQQQQMQRSHESQRLPNIQSLSPQGQTVVKVNPDGTYETKTYYFYPNPLVVPGINAPVNPLYP